MTQTLRIALLQLAGHGYDQAANLARGEKACLEAAARGADIALFPEMWNVAYTMPAEDGSGREEWARQAITLESPFAGRFRELARELGMAIGLTYLEAYEPRPRNSFALIDRRGEVVLEYAKVHTCEFSREAALTPGDEFRVAPLETAGGTVRIGAMICYDREYPESARLLMLQGAEVILVPNACELEDWRLHEIEVRAIENMTPIALANYAGETHGGRSYAYNGMVAAPDESTLETLVLEAGAEEGVYIAEFDIGALREYRARETLGAAYRRPEAYGLLASRDVRTRRRA